MLKLSAAQVQNCSSSARYGAGFVTGSPRYKIRQHTQVQNCIMICSTFVTNTHRCEVHKHMPNWSAITANLHSSSARSGAEFVTCNIRKRWKRREERKGGKWANLTSLPSNQLSSPCHLKFICPQYSLLQQAAQLISTDCNRTESRRSVYMSSNTVPNTRSWSANPAG